MKQAKDETGAQVRNGKAMSRSTAIAIEPALQNVVGPV